MRILFIHPYFPGQFTTLVRHLVAEGRHDIKAFSLDRQDGRHGEPVDGVVPIVYGDDVTDDRAEDHPLFETDRYLREAASLAFRAQALADSGWIPDLIVSHASWGAASLTAGLFPEARRLAYCEWHYGEAGNRPVDAGLSVSRGLSNLPILAEAAQADLLVSPTRFQRDRFPPGLAGRITVIPDGIDLDIHRPRPDAVLDLGDGLLLSAADRVVTYVARGADPYRGFGTAMQAFARLQEIDPDVHVVIVGDRKVYYGRGVGTESHFDETMASVRLDQDRTHFLGRVSPERYRSVLNISALHLFPSLAFVLSWSMLEAMASGCVVLGSDTAPVREFITEGTNGFLCDPGDAPAMAERMVAILAEGRHDAIRQAARETIAVRWSTQAAIAGYRSLIGLQASA